MNIDFNIGNIIEKHIYSIVLSVLCGLISLFWKKDLISFLIVLSVSFLLVEFITYCIKSVKRKNRIKNDNRQYDEYKLKELMKHADAVRSCFKTMKPELLNAAAVLYQVKQSNKYDNERFIGQNEEGWDSTYLFREKYGSQPFPYIKISGSSSKVHVQFEPCFYYLLQNYVENRIEEYPEDFNIKSLLDSYDNMIY